MTTYDLLSWGANSHNQLGQGIKSEQCVFPMAVDLKKELNILVSEIKKVTGGAGHSLILTIKGEVYSCGLNNKGQSGKPRFKKCLIKFERIEELKDEIIVDIAAGWDSSMAIDNNGNLYVWGSNAYGQLGLIESNNRADSTIDDNNNCLYEPKKIQFQELEKAGNSNPIIEIAMGLRHSVIVTDNGKVFVSGHGNKCQLGIIDSSNKPIRKITNFTQVPELFGIKSAACGQHHTMVLAKNGDLFGWGDNKHGQLGFDIEKYPIVEKPLKLENINVGLNGEIFTGWTHTAVLYDGKVLAWGRNTYGQLGSGELMNRSKTWIPELVKNIPKLIIQLSIGSEHNIALSEDGSIMCWGWNEHGNCGTGNEEDVRLPKMIKMQKNSRGKVIGTGYGHSFAVIENRKIEKV